MDGPVGWHGRLKRWLADRLALEDAALHAHIGMAIWLACVVVAGDAGAWWPLAVVAAIELANEAFDRLRTGSWRIADTLRDIAGTLLWPTLLFAMARAGLV